MDEMKEQLDRIESTVNGISKAFEILLDGQEKFQEEQALLFEQVRRMMIEKYLKEVKAS